MGALGISAGRKAFAFKQEHLGLMPRAQVKMMIYAYNPSTGEAETGGRKGSWGSLASWPRLISEIWASERLFLKGGGQPS